MLIPAGVQYGMDESQDWSEADPCKEEIFFYFYCNSPELGYSEGEDSEPEPAVDIQAYAVVPEPGTAALSLLALAGLALRRRRR